MCHLAFIVALRLDLDGVDDPSEERQDGDDQRAGQGEEQEQQQDPAVRPDLDVLEDHVPRGHLRRKCGGSSGIRVTGSRFYETFSAEIYAQKLKSGNYKFVNIGFKVQLPTCKNPVQSCYCYFFFLTGSNYLIDQHAGGKVFLLFAVSVAAAELVEVRLHVYGVGLEARPGQLLHLTLARLLQQAVQVQHAAAAGVGWRCKKGI
jgi:hypothetical protein